MIRIKAHERVGDTVKEVEVSFDEESFTPYRLADILDRLGYPSPTVNECQQPAVKIEIVKSDDGGWIPHLGGDCPVERGTRVDVKYRDGVVIPSLSALELSSSSVRDASICFWEDEGGPNDIIAYRVCK